MFFKIYLQFLLFIDFLHIQFRMSWNIGGNRELNSEVKIKNRTLLGCTNNSKEFSLNAYTISYNYRTLKTAISYLKWKI